MRKAVDLGKGGKQVCEEHSFGWMDYVNFPLEPDSAFTTIKQIECGMERYVGPFYVLTGDVIATKVEGELKLENRARIDIVPIFDPGHPKADLEIIEVDLSVYYAKSHISLMSYILCVVFKFFKERRIRWKRPNIYKAHCMIYSFRSLQENHFEPLSGRLH